MILVVVFVGIVEYFLFQENDVFSDLILLVIMLNCGLCGLYNVVILWNVFNYCCIQFDDGFKLLVEMVGKKGINYVCFVDILFEYIVMDVEDCIVYVCVVEMVDCYMQFYIEGVICCVDVVYIKFELVVIQIVMVQQLLLIEKFEIDDDVQWLDFEFLLDLEVLFSMLIFEMVCIWLYQYFNDVIVLEQVSWMVVMKVVMDLVGDMIKYLLQ